MHTHIYKWGSQTPYFVEHAFLLQNKQDFQLLTAPLSQGTRGYGCCRLGALAGTGARVLNMSRDQAMGSGHGPTLLRTFGRLTGRLGLGLVHCMGACGIMSQSYEPPPMPMNNALPWLRIMGRAALVNDGHMFIFPAERDEGNIRH